MTSPPIVPGDGEPIDRILDANATGLLYFERFLPLAGRIPGTDVPQYRHVCARYDEQRGLDLGALADDADAVGAMSTTLGEQLDEQVHLRRVLRMRWHGEAGEAVQDFLAAEHEKAALFVQSIEDSYQTMCAAIDVLRDAVTDKAVLVGELDVDRVDGKDIDQIDAIVTASGVECLPVDRPTVFPRLASAFEDLDERIRSADVSDEFAAVVTRRCREWIDTEFVPRVQSTCASVLEACTATDTAVDQCLALVAEVLGGVRDPSFADLDESRWSVVPESAMGGSAPVSDVPSASRAIGDVGTAPTGSGPVPVPSGPTHSVPSGGSAFVGGGDSDSVARAADVRPGDGNRVDEIVDRVVADIVARVDEALSEKLDGTQDDGAVDDRRPEADAGEKDVEDDRGPSTREESIQDAPTREESDAASARSGDGADPDAQANPGSVPPVEQSDAVERGHLEAWLDGHRARIAVEHDGSVSVELESPGVGTRSFELRIGPFGLPEVVEIPGVAHAAPATPTQQAPPVVLVPDPEPAPASETAPAPAPALDPAPASEAVTDPDPGTVSEPGPPLDAESQTPDRCTTESPEIEQPDGQSPTTADDPVSAEMPAASGTGAGLSEAGAL